MRDSRNFDPEIKLLSIQGKTYSLDWNCKNLASWPPLSVLKGFTQLKPRNYVTSCYGFPLTSPVRISPGYLFPGVCICLWWCHPLPSFPHFSVCFESANEAHIAQLYIFRPPQSFSPFLSREQRNLDKCSKGAASGAPSRVPSHFLLFLCILSSLMFHYHA